MVLLVTFSLSSSTVSHCFLSRHVRCSCSSPPSVPLYSGYEQAAPTSAAPEHISPQRPQLLLVVLVQPRCDGGLPHHRRRLQSSPPAHGQTSPAPRRLRPGSPPRLASERGCECRVEGSCEWRLQVVSLLVRGCCCSRHWFELECRCLTLRLCVGQPHSVVDILVSVRRGCLLWFSCGWMHCTRVAGVACCASLLTVLGAWSPRSAS